jgi:HlyD family secretion protein
MGASGLGSTAAPSGGGSSSGNDFTTVLQDLVKPGSPVKRGSVVAEFDRQYMRTRFDDYKANVAQAEASFGKMKAELAVEWEAHQQSISSAKSAWEKAVLDLKTLPVQSAITSEVYRLAASQAEASLKELRTEAPHLRAREQAQIRNAEIELTQARNELRRVQMNVDRMVVKAPIDGITVMQPIFRGSEFSNIEKGDQLYPGQLFMRVVDTSSMMVAATVNQVDVEKIRMGAKARIRFDAYPDLELPAHVYSVGALGKISRYRSGFVSEVPIGLKIDKMDPRVIPDLSVGVDVILDTERDATLVPLESIFSDEGAGQAPFVFVKNAGGWERRPVSLGVADNIEVVVRSGLRPGEVIAAEWPAGERRR